MLEVSALECAINTPNFTLYWAMAYEHIVAKSVLKDNSKLNRNIFCGNLFHPSMFLVKNQRHEDF